MVLYFQKRRAGKCPGRSFFPGKRGRVKLLLVGEGALRNELESRSMKLGIKGNPIVISSIFQVRCSRLSKDVKYVMHK